MADTTPFYRDPQFQSPVNSHVLYVVQCLRIRDAHVTFDGQTAPDRKSRTHIRTSCTALVEEREPHLPDSSRNGVPIDVFVVDSMLQYEVSRANHGGRRSREPGTEIAWMWNRRFHRGVQPSRLDDSSR